MTSKLVSLSRARKARARDDRAAKASANAAKHGRTKAERMAEDRAKAQAKAHLDGHKTDPEAP